MTAQTLAADATTPPKAIEWKKALAWLVLAGVLCWLPLVLTDRAILGVRLSNLQLLNLGLAQVNLLLIFALGAMSLNYLTGCAGLISIGHAAFYAVGAIAGAVTGTQFGWPFPLALCAAAVAGAAAGAIAGLPSLRVRGLYFVLSTLAMHFIVIFLMSEYQYRFFDVVGIPFNEARIGPFVLDTQIRWYFFLLALLALVYLALRNTLRTREGRALMAMRDHELAATAVGIDVRILRLKAFALSSAVASMAGAVYAYYMTNVNAEFFGINFAIQFIAMIIIGGMGSLPGSVLGAAVWLLLPPVITGFATEAGASASPLGKFLMDHKPQLVNLTFGVLVVVLLIAAPGGLSAIARRLQTRFFAGRRETP